MKRLLLLIVSIITLGAASAAAQGTATLRGTVVNTDGNPLPGVTVTLSNTGLATATNASGRFQFSGLAPAVYTVVIRGISSQVSLKAGEVKEFQITAHDQVTALQPVEIIGRKERGYKTNATFIGNKTQTAIRDLPQSVSYASKELMADQGATRIGDLVNNFSGVNQFSYYDDLTIRGFRVGSGSTQLVNGMRSSTGFWKQPLTNYLERVEVLKGPSSVLYGNSSPGGVVNRVTKKPLDETRRQISVNLGSYNTLRALGDFTGPATKDSSLLYRLNLGYEDRGSFRDLQYDKNIVIAPSLSFLPDDKTRINFDLVYNSSRSRLDRGQAVINENLYSIPTSVALNVPNDRLNENTYMVTLSAIRQLAKNFNVTLTYLKTGYNEDLYEHRTTNANAVDGAGKPIANLVGMQILTRVRRRFIDNFSGFFNYNLKTGPVEQKFVFGYDHGSEKMPAGSSQQTASGYRNAANNGTIARYIPANKSAYLLDRNGNPVPNVPSFDMDNIRGSQQLQDDSKVIFRTLPMLPSLYYLNAGYIQDQIKWKALQVMLSVRYENYTDFINYDMEGQQKINSHAWLPRLGLVYSVVDNINLYGSYTQGYTPQNVITLADPNAGGPFDPLISNMGEFGAKGSFFNNRLSVTTSVYKIQERNVLYSANDEENPDLMRQVGKVISKGFEFDVTGLLTPQWSIIASYSLNKAYIAESPYEDEVGVQNPNAPRNRANLWTRYNIAAGAAKGLGLAAGFSFIDRRNLMTYPVKQLPGYTVFNAAAFYTIGKMQLQFNANNLGNKTYWVGGYDFLRLFPGTPRNYLATITYNF